MRFVLQVKPAGMPETVTVPVPVSPPSRSVNCACNVANCAIRASICTCNSAAVNAEAGAGTATTPSMVTTVTIANIFLNLLIL